LTQRQVRAPGRAVACVPCGGIIEVATRILEPAWRGGLRRRGIDGRGALGAADGADAFGAADGTGALGGAAGGAGGVSAEGFAPAEPLLRRRMMYDTMATAKRTPRMVWVAGAGGTQGLFAE